MGRLGRSVGWLVLVAALLAGAAPGAAADILKGKEGYDALLRAAGKAGSVTVGGRAYVIAPSGTAGLPGFYEGGYQTKEVTLPDGRKVRVVDPDQPLAVGRPTRTDGIEYPERVLALMGKDVDVALQVPFPNVQQLKTAGFRTFQTLSSAWGTMTFAAKTAPTDDVRVRKAIMHAIDRKALIDATLEGVGVVNGPVPAALTDWALPIDQLGEGAKYYKHDKAEAKRLLAAAGHPNGFPASVCFAAVAWTKRSFASLASFASSRARRAS